MADYIPGLEVTEFEDLLTVWGGDLQDWPKDKQGPARRLISYSDEARHLLAETQQMETLLSRPRELKAPAGLSDRIFKKAFSLPS